MGRRNHLFLHGFLAFWGSIFVVGCSESHPEHHIYVKLQLSNSKSGNLADIPLYFEDSKVASTDKDGAAHVRISKAVGTHVLIVPKLDGRGLLAEDLKPVQLNKDRKGEVFIRLKSWAKRKLTLRRHELLDEACFGAVVTVDGNDMDGQWVECEGPNFDCYQGRFNSTDEQVELQVSKENGDCFFGCTITLTKERQQVVAPVHCKVDTIKNKPSIFDIVEPSEPVVGKLPKSIKEPRSPVTLEPKVPQKYQLTITFSGVDGSLLSNVEIRTDKGKILGTTDAQGTLTTLVQGYKGDKIYIEALISRPWINIVEKNVPVILHNNKIDVSIPVQHVNKLMVQLQGVSTEDLSEVEIYLEPEMTLLGRTDEAGRLESFLHVGPGEEIFLRARFKAPNLSLQPARHRIVVNQGNNLAMLQVKKTNTEVECPSSSPRACVRSAAKARVKRLKTNGCYECLVGIRSSQASYYKKAQIELAWIEFKRRNITGAFNRLIKLIKENESYFDAYVNLAEMYSLSARKSTNAERLKFLCRSLLATLDGEGRFARNASLARSRYLMAKLYRLQGDAAFNLRSAEESLSIRNIVNSTEYPEKCFKARYLRGIAINAYKNYQNHSSGRKFRCYASKQLRRLGISQADSGC